MTERESEGERERDKEREKQTNRQTGKDREKQRDTVYKKKQNRTSKLSISAGCIN